MLQAQIDRECAEKLELKHIVRKLEKDLKHREEDVLELKANVERQCHRYNELWRAHGHVLMKVQTVRSHVLIKSFGSRAEGAGGRTGGANSRSGGANGDQTRSTSGWPERSRDGPRARVADVGGVGRVHLFLVFM